VRDDPFKQNTPHQLLVKSWIENAGIGTILEEDFGKYVVDIYIPDLLLGIEIDGPYHLKKRDRLRDGYLKESFGIDIWRISDKDIKVSYRGELIDRIMARVKEME
tara:strand:- start:6833 stop:7147 length:315 start_codon:yes stop_codon:yes gene_type:complete